MLDEYTNELANKWPNAYVKLKQLDYSVAATPIEVRLRGENLVALRLYADSIIYELSQMEGLVNVQTNHEEILPSFKVDLDPL